MKTIIRSALAAALMTGSALAVSAAPVTQNFTAEIVSQTPTGIPNYVGVTGTGFVTFDDAAPAGNISLAPGDFGLNLDFTTGTETFNGSTTDPFLQALLTVDGSGGVTALDFTQLDDDTFTLAIEDLIAAPGIIAFSISGITLDNGMITSIDLDAEVELVPLPGALPLMLGALGIAGFAARRKSK